jgi:hypothetical protein
MIKPSFITAALLLVGAISISNADQRTAEPNNDPQQVLRDLNKGHRSGRMVRDEPNNLKVSDMTVDELKQRLADYESGNRDDRDGYIIANQLWFDYQGRKENGSADAQHAKQVREQLLQKHPEFNNLQDFRLSDKIKYQAVAQQQKKQAETTAKGWTPPDSVPRKVYGQDRQAVVAYQFKLVFYDLPSDVRVKTVRGDTTGLFRGDKQIGPEELTPKKTLSFRRSFSLPIEGSPLDYHRLLVCTSALASGYNAMTNEETKAMRPLGHGTHMQWAGKTGNFNHFCGVISLGGDVVYQFNIAENPPARVISPIGISFDGARAAVMVGQKVSEEDGEGFFIGRPSEVWIWQYPATVKKVAVTDPSKTTDDDLRRNFYTGKL